MTAVIDALDSVARFVRGLEGWRRGLFALAAGLVSALGFAPFGFFPALLIGFALLVLLVDRAVARQRPYWSAFQVGWLFGFGHFAGGMYWVGFAFLVDPAQHLWQMPVGIIGLPGLLAFFPALACALPARLWGSGPVRILIFALAYAIFEWLRGHVFSGFPWNLPGYGWTTLPQLFQSTALFGVYGLSLLTILFGASLAVLCEERARRWLFPASLAGLFVVMWSLGSLRETFTPTAFVPGVQLRIVQPNIPQAEKYVPDLVVRNWRRLTSISRIPGPTPTHLIWPEAAPPFVLQNEPVALDEITLLTARGTVLITGAVRTERQGDGRRKAYNSLYVIGRAGRLIGVYDKFHLVPFGEYLPLEPLMSAIGLTKLVGIGSFASGDGPRTLQVPGAPPVGPIICYEAIFPGAVAGEPRPGWLVNVSDDSWFGSWAGPEQHLVIAQVRAIEEGLPIVRATNTGISAVIDPLGRVKASLGLGRMGALDAQLPESRPLTPYGRFGDLGFLFMLLLGGAITLFWHRRN